MKSEEVNFRDALTGLPVHIVAQSQIPLDPEEDRGFSTGVFVGLDYGDGVATVEAHVPKKQVEEIIEAMKEALNEEGKPSV